MPNDVVENEEISGAPIAEVAALSTLRVGVVGASGFIGSAVANALESRNCLVKSIQAPRLAPLSGKQRNASAPPNVPVNVSERLVRDVQGCDVVINAAGISAARSHEDGNLFASNALLPLAVLRSCQEVGVQRFVHISSAAVQGDTPILDSATSYRPLSPYARSKVLGEQWLLHEIRDIPRVVIYRPQGVHAADRAVTRSIRRLGALSLLPVAGDGSRPAPQALVANVGDAIAFLATSKTDPPTIVHHPWEGLSCEEFVYAISGQKPWRIHDQIAKWVVGFAAMGEQFLPYVAPHRRRFQVLSLGQSIGPSWLDEVGWKAPYQKANWFGGESAAGARHPRGGGSS